MTDTNLPHILIVDDDQGIRDLLQRYLSEQGMRVATAQDAKSMDTYLAENSIDLLVLDVMMPGEDGLSIARRVSDSNGPPIIMLSAKGEDIEKIIGLEMGADDYMAKPFNPRELLARIKSVLRRSPQLQNTTTKEENESHEYCFGDYKLDVSNHQLSCRGQTLEITGGEFALLQVFSAHANRVLSRDQLMDMLKRDERDPFDRSIDIKVTRLRKKIENDPKSPKYIRTVWGSGYMFTPEGFIK
ncbi:MAG: response regulator [Gammaproteobacteria bacterium]|nr:response regulator [Gammaproteobacteria bacterium]